jgi:glycerate-2-kinase
MKLDDPLVALRAMFDAAIAAAPRERLDDNDGHGFFEALGDSVVTGPTLTNVNDFRAILIAPDRANRRD